MITKDDHPVTIAPLLSHPSYIPAVAALLYAEWPQLYALESVNSAEQLAHTLSSRAPSALPLTLIALTSERPANPSTSPTLLGTVTLDVADVPRSFPYYGVAPWMSSLLVIDSARGQGVGRALALGVQREGQRRGLRWLWLWTVRSAPLYERWGWRLIEQCWFEEKGKHVAVMRKDLDGAKGSDGQCDTSAHPAGSSVERNGRRRMAP